MTRKIEMNKDHSRARGLILYLNFIMSSTRLNRAKRRTREALKMTTMRNKDISETKDAKRTP